MIKYFQNEGEDFRLFMQKNTDFVVVRRNADGSCLASNDTEVIADNDNLKEQFQNE
jgi:hypothetical protein